MLSVSLCGCFLIVFLVPFWLCACACACACPCPCLLCCVALCVLLMMCDVASMLCCVVSVCLFFCYLCCAVLKMSCVGACWTVSNVMGVADAKSSECKGMQCNAMQVASSGSVAVCG